MCKVPYILTAEVTKMLQFNSPLVDVRKVCFLLSCVIIHPFWSNIALDSVILKYNGPSLLWMDFEKKHISNTSYNH